METSYSVPVTALLLYRNNTYQRVAIREAVPTLEVHALRLMEVVFDDRRDALADPLPVDKIRFRRATQCGEFAVYEEE